MPVGQTSLPKPWATKTRRDFPATSRIRQAKSNLRPMIGSIIHLTQVALQTEREPVKSADRSLAVPDPSTASWRSTLRHEMRQVGLVLFRLGPKIVFAVLCDIANPCCGE